jgi:C-terminal processing protease CtpA/Prc
MKHVRNRFGDLDRTHRMAIGISSALLAGLLGACSLTRPPAPPPPIPAGATAPLPRAAIVADLDSLLATIERVHPNPYTVVSRDSVRRLRDRFVAALPDTLSRATAWPAYARIVASFGDGHTNLYPPGEELAHWDANGGLTFPVSVAVNDLGGLTTNAYWRTDSLIHRGDAILGVNGRSADSLFHLFGDEISGESDAFRKRQMAGVFGTYLWYNDIRSPFTLDVRSPADSVTRHVIVDGVPLDTIRARLRRGRGGGAGRGQGERAGATSPFLSYRRLNDDVGYVDLFTLSGTIERFRSDLDAALIQAMADSSRGLVIDLRRNGGGDSRLGDELLAHFTSTPYRMSAEKQWKMSAEYRAFMKATIAQPYRSLRVAYLHPEGRRLFSGPDGKIVTHSEPAVAHAPREPRFTGAVCVIIGPGTFSSATDLADAIKTYHLATLVGEETGGRPNSFGEVYWFRTQRTGFVVDVSSALFIRASGDTSDHRGVVPDIEVRRSAADIAVGRDAALESATNCARSLRRSSR